MQKISSLLLALIACAGTMFADGTKIGDLYYNLNADNKTAEVTYQERSRTNYSYLTAINIPESVNHNSVTYSVTSIGESAFSACTGLTSITIPNSVTSIGRGTFSGCTSLTNVTIGNSVTSIGSSAFSGCSGLTSITIPNSVTSIGESAFARCDGLTSVNIGNGVTSIGGTVFYGCTRLKSLTCDAVNPPQLGLNVFYNYRCSLYVPANSVEAYKESSWSGYFNIYPIRYYFVAGTMNDWNVGANRMYADNNNYKVSIALEANSEYFFKIVHVDGTNTAWYGAGMDATMHYGNSTDWSLCGDANVRLETTQKGNYEFIFVPNEAKKISVIIPARTYSVVGPLCPDGWDQTSTKCDMTLVNGIYTFRMQNVRLEKNVKYEYKIVQNHSWVGSLPQEGSAEFYVEETSLYNLTFTFNPSTKKYGVNAVLPEKKYFVAGTMNGWNVGANPMKKDENDKFRTSIELEANSEYLFKIVCVCGIDTAWYGAEMGSTMYYGNSTDWSLCGDADIRLKTTQKGNCEFIFVPNDNKKISVIIPAPEEHTYSVVGPLCPDGWDQTSTRCNMSYSSQGIYAFWMRNVRLEKNVKYEYKIVQDHSWDVAFPQEGSAEFYVEETNLYTLTFTFNPSTKEYGVNAVLPEKKYFVAGTMNDWNVGANQMHAADNSFKTSIALDSESEYLFKIVYVCGIDTAWYGAEMEATMRYGNSTDWSLCGDANVHLKTTEKTYYEFIFVPNDNKKISVIIPALREHTYSVVGPLCPDGWVQTSTKCDMTLVDGIYTFRMQNVRLEKNVNYEYKIVKDHSWDESFPKGGNAKFTVEQTNIYNLTFTFNPSTKENGVTPVPVTVQLAGDLINEWSPEYMTPDKEYRTASITKNLKAGTIKFKVIITGGWSGDSQVFTRDNNTQTVTSNGQDMTLVADMDGDYVFTWTYATNSLQIIYPKIEGIEKVLSPGMVIKLLRDGRVLILRGDKTYTVTGQQLK